VYNALFEEAMYALLALLALAAQFIEAGVTACALLGCVWAEYLGILVKRAMWLTSCLSMSVKEVLLFRIGAGRLCGVSRKTAVKDAQLDWTPGIDPVFEVGLNSVFVDRRRFIGAEPNYGHCTVPTLVRIGRVFVSRGVRGRGLEWTRRGDR